MKFLNKHQKPIKATRVPHRSFWCLWCNKEFDNRPQKEEHQESCKKKVVHLEVKED